MNNQDVLINGDCLEVMKDIADQSVDLVLCDLPYGVLNRRNEHALWDNCIPTNLLWEQYERILSERGNILLFGQGLFSANLIISNTAWYRYSLVWVKDLATDFLNCNHRPMRIHEDVNVFSRIPHSTYNPQMTYVGYKAHSHGSGNNQVMHQRTYGCVKRTPNREGLDRYPKTVIYFPKAKGKGYYHPNEKPVDLLRYLIRQYSDMGGVVLDNTMGSGSTCVAAYKEKRHYIGIEKEKEYYDIAVKRMNEEKHILTLNFD